jgi:hypothetical protein
MDRDKPKDEDLRRFRAEAAVLLGIAENATAPGKDKSAPKP